MRLLGAWTLLLLSAGFSLAQQDRAAPYVPPAPQPAQAPELPPSQPEINRPRQPPAPEPEPEPLPVVVPLERPPGRFWVDADYATFWFKGADLAAPLLTTGPLSAALPGFVGDPGTVALFGQQDLDYGALPGGKFASGVWFNRRRTIGLEARAFFTDRGTVGTATQADSTGNPFLLRPFFDPSVNSEAVATIAVPDLLTGGFSADSTSRMFGGDASLLFNLVQEWRVRADLLVGFLYLDLRESLELNEHYGPIFLAGGNAVPFNGGIVDFPHIIQVHDQFHTRNQFYGSQVGARVNCAFDRLDVILLTKIALGSTHQVVDVFGVSTDQVGGGPVITAVPGGLLALPTNIGRFTQDVFTVAPSAEIKLGWWLTRSMRLQAGYAFLFWSNVARPGNQIDRRLNNTQVPTFATFAPGPANPPLPAPSLDRTEAFWVQSIDVGVEFRY